MHKRRKSQLEDVQKHAIARARAELAHEQQSVFQHVTVLLLEVKLPGRPLVHQCASAAMMLSLSHGL